jgi:hypothetical protein
MPLPIWRVFLCARKVHTLDMKTSKPAKFGSQTQAIRGGEPNRRGERLVKD